MEKRKCFILEYKCEDASPGRHIVVAFNANDALDIFFKNWKSQYKAGEVAISPDELQNIEVHEWCDWCDLMGRY